MKSLLVLLAFLAAQNSQALMVDKKAVRFDANTNERATETITLSNDTNLAVEKLKVLFYPSTIGGDNRGFPLVMETNCGTTLRARASCSIYVDFQPDRRGSFWGVIEVYGKKTRSIYATLEARTENQDVPTAGLEFSEEKIDFGTIAKYGFNRKYLVITNRDNINIEFRNIQLLGNNRRNFRLLNVDCQKTLAVGAKCLMEITGEIQGGEDLSDLDARIYFTTRDYDYDIPVTASCWSDQNFRCQ